jgi:DNA-binding LytR/AlgR family response regulator
MIRILIIEDERLIADELQAMLLRLSDEVVIISALRSVQDAVDYLSHDKSADLIFSDIQLPDGLSFDIFNRVDCTVPVIFITAFDRFMVNAFENNAIDYLLKPVSEKDLLKVLNKYKMLDQHFGKRQQFFNSFTKEKKRIVVRKGMANILLRLEDIVLFYTESKIIYTIDREGRKYVCDQNLGQLEEELAEAGFFRVNRQYLLNAEYIRGYKAYEKVKLLVDLAVSYTDHPIIVSQETAPYFRRWMNEI